MGKLIYGNAGVVINLEDRVLAHLQIIVSAKLRRNEAFFFSWKDGVATGSSRGSVWIERSIPLYFHFKSMAMGPLNRSWLEKLTQSANSSQGLILTEEPVEEEAPLPVAAVAAKVTKTGQRVTPPRGSTSPARTLTSSSR